MRLKGRKRAGSEPNVENNHQEPDNMSEELSELHETPNTPGSIPISPPSR
jgi:hypothetical protein